MKQRNILTIVFTLFCVATIMAQNVDNEKTGILLVHYGTSNDKSRAQTIDKLNSRVAETFPDCAVVEAYSAPSVIKMLAKRGIKKLYISQALDSLKALGCNKQVVLVGHGSDSPANAMYCQIDYLLKTEGKSSWHVGTIEGFPKIENVEQQLKNSKNKNVILVPLLYIAGNHQKEDIDGVWKTQLQTKGYHVDVFGKGIGEMTEIQNMIIGKIDAQIKTVNSEKAK